VIVVQSEGARSVRATFAIQIAPAVVEPGALHEKITDVMGDLLMETLLGEEGVIDPIVSTDLDTQELSVSFGFDATGRLDEDSAHAMQTLGSAFERLSQPGGPAARAG
jgi:hypothetical protein